MGYSSTLKKIRKYSAKEIDPIIDKLKNEDDIDLLFNLAEEACRLIEAHFSIGRKDNKLYNKYRNEVNNLLKAKVFNLEMIKPKDRKLTIEELSKKPLNFIYTLIATEFDKINTFYMILKRNIMPSWFKIEGDKDNLIIKPELNDQSFAIKNEKEKVIEIIKATYKIISENNLYENLISNDRIDELINLINTKIKEIEKLPDSFKKVFYQCKYKELQEALELVPKFRTYIDSIYPAIKTFIELENN